MLKDLGQIGVWLSSEGLDASQFNEERASAFLTARRVAGQRRIPGPRAMTPLLTYLRETGVAPPQQPPVSPLGGLLGQYRSWMVQERGLAAMTVLRYENTARRFLREQASANGAFEPAALTGADINAFLLRECGRVSAGSAKGRVAELRSILRFLHLQGSIPLPLGAAVPPVGGWRFATLPPPTINAADVQRLLDSCDRSSAVGIRNFAIMTLIARLGLRSIEVARLELCDVDWRATGTRRPRQRAPPRPAPVARRGR
jgi:site-specific recombinase XerC